LEALLDKKLLGTLIVYPGRTVSWFEETRTLVVPAPCLFGAAGAREF
jgi:hypothetical protein